VPSPTSNNKVIMKGDLTPLKNISAFRPIGKNKVIM
jgi:hypothetical protein